jgi:D-arabinose 1-dehydrogenase-like Zn-dependent alcohol dehydrogenase
MKSSGLSDGPPNFIDILTKKPINFGECCTYVRRGVFPENRLTKINEKYENSELAPVGCAFLTAFAAIKLATNGFKKNNNKIAIVGVGGIGLAAALISNSLNIKTTCIDKFKVINNIKKNNLKNINRSNITEAKKKLINKFDTVLICSGAVEAFELGEKLLKKNMGSMYIIGNPPFGRQSSLAIKFIKKCCPNLT